MNMPASAMQSLTMLQAALTAAQPKVDDAQMAGQVPTSPGVGGPGNTAAAVGNMASGLLRGNQGGIAPTKNAMQLAELGGTQPLSTELEAAMMEAGTDRRRYAQTASQRFSTATGIGRAESLYDLFRGKRAFKDMQESEQTLREEQINQRRLQEQSMLQAESERRAEYVKNLLPQYIANNPGINHQAAVAFLTQAAAQDMPVEKVLPEGAPTPVKETYIDPQTKAEMTRWRHPETGQIMQGDQWKPFVSKGASAKTTGAAPKQMLTYEDGIEYQTTYSPVPDANGDLQILGRTPTGKNVNVKPFVQMSPENRKYGSMVANATALVSQALPLMFDTNGDWNSAETLVPGSDAKSALLAYKNAIRQSIRPESGAAVPPEEVEAAEMMYLPKHTDSDVTAQGKVLRFAEYQSRMYNGMFSGFSEVPENMMFTDYTQPWMDTVPAQIAQVKNQVEDKNTELDAAFQAAMIKARKAQGNP